MVRSRPRARDLLGAPRNAAPCDPYVAVSDPYVAVSDPYVAVSDPYVAMPAARREGECAGVRVPKASVPRQPRASP